MAASPLGAPVLSLLEQDSDCDGHDGLHGSSWGSQGLSKQRLWALTGEASL